MKPTGPGAAGKPEYGLERDLLGMTRRFTAWVFMALLIGVVLRLGLILATTSPENPKNLLYPGFTDGSAYLKNARSLLETGVYGYAGRASAFRPPAYPALLALSLKAFGNSLTPIRLFQVALFVVMTAVYVAVARQSFGPLAGVLTAWMFAIYPLFVFLSSEIATESVYMVLEAIVFFLCVRPGAVRDGPGRRAATSLAVGLCCGAGTLTRPNMVAVFVLALALIVWREVGQGRGVGGTVRVVVLLILGFGAIVGPWIVRNRLSLGSSVLTTNLEYNLFRGTFDLIQGIPGGEDIEEPFRENGVLYEGEIEDPSVRTLPWSEVENERRAHAAAWRIIEHDVSSWLRERLRNAVYLWLNLEWEPNILKGTPQVRWLAVIVTVVYYIVLGLACVGSVNGFRSGGDSNIRRLVFSAWLFVLGAMPVVLAFVGKRYRISMIDPYLIPLAAATLEGWLKNRAQRFSRDTITIRPRVS